MIYNILTMIHGVLVLLFGVFLSASFAGIKINRKNFAILISLSAFSGLLQVLLIVFKSVEAVWIFYPVIAHLPLVVVLCVLYRKHFAAAIAAVCTSYLCCQPSKWFGILAFYISGNDVLNYIVRIVSLIVIFPLIFRFISPIFAEIFNRDRRSVYIFNIAPIVYYFYDYITVVYTDLLHQNNIIATEFMPFFLLIVYFMMCILYYREYEQKVYAERKEHIINITLDEQRREIDAIKKIEHEIRLMRHDMRLLLNNVAICIDNNDKETAQKMISVYIDNVYGAQVKKYCGNTTLNYIISSYAQKCNEHNIAFSCKITADEINCDEVMLSTIISNALDNAINAQLSLPEEKRTIRLKLRNHNNKLLLSVKNHFAERPVFIDGKPVTGHKGHGYGTQSIAYLSERMGGNCRFAIEDDNFVLMVVV